MEIFIVLIIIIIGLIIWMFGGERTVKNTSIDLDNSTLVLNDLKQRGFSLPHVIIFADKSGRVCKGYVHKENNFLFHFNHIDDIASEYVRWQADWRME